MKNRYKNISQVLVAHVYNPSYSGGREQEDQSSKPAQATNSQDPISGWREKKKSQMLKA
jgi:hypothetical protein